MNDIFVANIEEMEVERIHRIFGNKKTFRIRLPRDCH